MTSTIAPPHMQTRLWVGAGQPGQGYLEVEVLEPRSAPGSVDEQLGRFWLQAIRASVHITSTAMFRMGVPLAECTHYVTATITVPQIRVIVRLPDSVKAFKSRRVDYRRTIKTLAAEISGMSHNVPVIVTFVINGGASDLSYEHRP